MILKAVAPSVNAGDTVGVFIPRFLRFAKIAVCQLLKLRFSPTTLSILIAAIKIANVKNSAIKFAGHLRRSPSVPALPLFATKIRLVCGRFKSLSIL